MVGGGSAGWMAAAALGKIVGTHGVRGEVKMDIYSDRPEEIQRLRRIYLDDDLTPRTINRPRGTERQAILKIHGVDSAKVEGGKVSVTEDAVEAEQGHGQFVGREAKNPVNRALSTWKEISAPRAIQRSGIPATGV